MAGSQSDITARKLAEERLAYDAIHDSLTGLPNRVLFMDRLESHLAHAKRNPTTLFAVLFIDIDRFKLVNDSLGHAVGDQLLVTVSQRLKLSLRPEDTVSRLGGDEFAILLDEVKDISDVIRVAERIKAGLVTTMFLGGVERSPTASIGIILYNSSYTKPSELLRDADTAMYHAKALGGNRYQLFNESMHINALELIQLEGDLKRAIAKHEWLVYYQPIVSLGSGETIGAEALVRWLHPKRGIVLPDKFIHIAEETGQISAIGEFVLRTACAQCKAWRDAGRSEMWVSVNLSGRQFQDQNLVEMVKQILIKTGLPGNGLLLEITESVAIWDIDYTVRILNDLAKLGVYASLDDFGTGYSSINHLKRFPFKSLKIDQSFIREIHSNKKSASLTVAIISMARSLELEVVAEGVEKEEQLSFLRTQLCNNAQGFLIDHPMPADDLTRVLHISVDSADDVTDLDPEK
jgi:diguanylate cyclase (GGDEF)-like protein